MGCRRLRANIHSTDVNADIYHYISAQKRRYFDKAWRICWPSHQEQLLQVIRFFTPPSVLFAKHSWCPQQVFFPPLAQLRLCAEDCGLCWWWEGRVIRCTTRVTAVQVRSMGVFPTYEGASSWGCRLKQEHNKCSNNHSSLTVFIYPDNRDRNEPINGSEKGKLMSLNNQDHLAAPLMSSQVEAGR